MEIIIDRATTYLPDPSAITARCTGPDEWLIDLDGLAIYCTLEGFSRVARKMHNALVEAGHGREVAA